MKKSVINEVFEYLKQIKAVDSESEFSKDWLGRSESYLRTLRFKNAQPSVGTLAICASKLLHYGNVLNAKQRHSKIAKQLLLLSEACHEKINHLSKEKW